jgi:hypothetical protein
VSSEASNSLRSRLAPTSSADSAPSRRRARSFHGACLAQGQRELRHRLGVGCARRVQRGLERSGRQALGVAQRQLAELASGDARVELDARRTQRRVHVGEQLLERERARALGEAERGLQIDPAPARVVDGERGIDAALGVRERVRQLELALGAVRLELGAQASIELWIRQRAPGVRLRADGAARTQRLGAEPGLHEGEVEVRERERDVARPDADLVRPGCADGEARRGVELERELLAGGRGRRVHGRRRAQRRRRAHGWGDVARRTPPWRAALQREIETGAARRCVERGLRLQIERRALTERDTAQLEAQRCTGLREAALHAPREVCAARERLGQCREAAERGELDRLRLELELGAALAQLAPQAQALAGELELDALGAERARREPRARDVELEGRALQLAARVAPEHELVGPWLEQQVERGRRNAEVAVGLGQPALRSALQREREVGHALGAGAQVTGGQRQLAAQRGRCAAEREASVEPLERGPARRERSSTELAHEAELSRLCPRDLGIERHVTARRHAADAPESRQRLVSRAECAVALAQEQIDVVQRALLVARAQRELRQWLCADARLRQREREGHACRIRRIRRRAQAQADGRAGQLCAQLRRLEAVERELELGAREIVYRSDELERPCCARERRLHAQLARRPRRLEREARVAVEGERQLGLAQECGELAPANSAHEQRRRGGLVLPALGGRQRSACVHAQGDGAQRRAERQLRRGTVAQPQRDALDAPERCAVAHELGRESIELGARAAVQLEVCVEREPAHRDGTDRL